MYKAECALGYATTESEGGLFVDLATHVAFGREYVEAAFAKTGNPAYLRCGPTPKGQRKATFQRLRPVQPHELLIHF